MPRSQFKPEFIILGAGPNGLYAAANLKLHKPNAKILIVERNEKYTRDYHLAIDKRSYFGSYRVERFCINKLERKGSRYE